MNALGQRCGSSGGVRTSQEEPGQAGEARRSQEESGGARRSQEESRKSQEEPGGARRSQEEPGVARSFVLQSFETSIFASVQEPYFEEPNFDD